MKRENIFAACIYLFIASLFFSFAVAMKVFTMGLLVLVAMLFNTPAQKLNLFKERKYVWFTLAFAIMMLISWLLSENKSDGARAVQLRLPLFLFPISLGLIGLSKGQRNRILLGCSIIVTLACLTSLLLAMARYQQTNDSVWLYNDALTLFIGQQSIYTSLLVNISIYVFAYHVFFSSLSRKRKLWLVVAIGFLFIFSYLLASRNMMMILYSSVLFFSFYFMLKKKKYLEGATLLAGMIIVGFLILKLFPQTINRFRELAYTQFDFQSQAKESHYAGELTPDQWNGANFRLAAWQCGWQLFQEHPLAGVGLGDKKDELFRVYRQKQFQFAISTNKNVHNNYLDILYSMGVAGLLLFLLGWILIPIVLAFRNRDGLGMLIVLTLALAMITENYFDRSLGAILFAFFITFIMVSHKQRTVDNPSPY